MRHEYLSCDMCGYGDEKSSFIKINSYQLDLNTNNFWKGWASQDLCEMCREKYKLVNPDIKIRIYYPYEH